MIFRLAQKLSYLLVDFSYRFADLLSTPRLPPVPEETALPPEETLYRGGMSVESYPQGYSQTSTAPTMPTSQMSVNMHGKYASLTIFFKVPYLRRTKQNPYRITLDGQSESLSVKILGKCFFFFKLWKTNLRTKITKMWMPLGRF